MLWSQEQREEIKKSALERHRHLSRLFREDRLGFERERKRMIRELIESAEDPEEQKKLEELQATWDKRMRGAGSEHNRFVLAQTFFWENFHVNWLPALTRFNDLLKGQAK